MSAAEYSVTLTNGGPWGFRLQGGKDFGKPLSIARVTPGGKADLQGILQGDIIEEINSQPADHLVHLDAQNLIKVSKDSLHLRLVRKPGNIAQSMGTKSPVVITETAHSARVDHKFNAKPRPFGVQSAPVQVKPVSRPAVDPDSFEDSEVLKMLKNSSISNDSGLSSSAHSSEDFDDLPPPPPEAFGAEDDQVPAGQSRTFKLLQRTVDGGESHPSVLSSPDSRPSTVSRPYNVTTNARSNKLPPQPMNTKEPPPCPPGVKPLQVLPSEVNFTRPSDAARAAYAERRQLGSSPTPAAPPPSQPYNSRPITAASPPSQPYNSRPITAASPPSQPYNSGPTTAAAPPSPPYNSGPTTAAHPPGQPYNCRPTTAASQPSQPYNSGHTTAAPQPSQPYNSGPTTAPKPRSPVSSSNPQNPHCHGCGQIIQGSFLSALGRNWHPEHFNCAGCRKSLQNKGFVEESDNLYCESCYDMKFSPHCDVCNQSIVGPCVKAIGKMFHPEHFICAHCGKQIANESFHLDSGKPYCAQDYKDLFCVKCCTCKQVIGGGDRWLEALDKPWHADCFRCAVCGQNLENTGFYSMGSQAVCPKHA